MSVHEYFFEIATVPAYFIV